MPKSKGSWLGLRYCGKNLKNENNFPMDFSSIGFDLYRLAFIFCNLLKGKHYGI